MRIGYARVSTEDQCLDLQINALEAAGCDIVLRDVGVSGTRERRDGLTEALDAIGEGDQLVTWRFDRIARSLRHLMDIAYSLNVKGAAFISLTENIDTSSSSGMLVLQIFGAVAEFERRLLIERTKAGLAAARKRGTRIGRRRKLSDADLAISMQMLRDGLSANHIASEFGISRATIYRYKNLSRFHSPTSTIV